MQSNLNCDPHNVLKYELKIYCDYIVVVKIFSESKFILAFTLNSCLQNRIKDINVHGLVFGGPLTSIFQVRY